MTATPAARDVYARPGRPPRARCSRARRSTPRSRRSCARSRPTRLAVALYWIAGPDDRALRCHRSGRRTRCGARISSRHRGLGHLRPAPCDDPAGAPRPAGAVWIEDLSCRCVGRAPRSELAARRRADVVCVISPSPTRRRRRRDPALRAAQRTPDDATLALMAEVGHDTCELFRRRRRRRSRWRPWRARATSWARCSARSPTESCVFDGEGDSSSPTTPPPARPVSPLASKWRAPAATMFWRGSSCGMRTAGA